MRTLRSAVVIFIAMIVGNLLSKPAVTEILAPYYNFVAGILKQSQGNLTNLIATGIIYVLVALLLAFITATLDKRSQK